MSKILFITPMWNEEATPCDAKVCNYFVDEWIKQGHKVVIAHYRSSFPSLYLKVAKVVPALGRYVCGDNCRLNKAKKEFSYKYKGAIAYSIPIFKYIPHSRFSSSTLDNHSEYLKEKLSSLVFIPDVIIGHFCNPTLGIINRIKSFYPLSKTCVVLHEHSQTIKHVFGDKSDKLLNSVSSIGFRSSSIKEDILNNFALTNRQFMCFSGVAASYIKSEPTIRKWTDGQLSSFVYIGRLACYKYPQVIPEALLQVYPDKNFSLAYIGSKDKAYQLTQDVVYSNHISDKVSFLGQVKRNEIIDWYDKYDCFVMVSDHEVFGLVYLEAMLRGCITIAGDNSGMVGIIEDGKNGFLCKPGDANALAAVIAHINALSAFQKSEISRKAIETAKRYTDESVAANYLRNALI